MINQDLEYNKKILYKILCNIHNSSKMKIKIEDRNKELIEKLRSSGISTKMKSLEDCDFLIYVEHNKKIIGAGGVGGLFHVSSLQIDPEYVNSGLGVKIFSLIVNEVKKRNYSFLAGSRNPENTNAVNIHDFFGYIPIVQVHYRNDFVRDVVFMEFNNKGKIIKEILKIFNSKFGVFSLVLTIKIFRKILFKTLLTYTPEEFPSPDLIYAIRNFEKI